LLVEHDGEDKAMRDIRKHTAWYLMGFPIGSQLRRQSKTSPPNSTPTLPSPPMPPPVPAAAKAPPKPKSPSPTAGSTTPKTTASPPPPMRSGG
jgi:hypothetical protein